MHLETEIEWTQRCTWRPGSREFKDALGGHDRANMQAVIERVWRYTWMPWSSECGDALGGEDRVNSEDALGGRDRSSLEMHFEAVTERVWRCSCRLWSSEIGGVLGGGRFGGRHASSWDSIHWLTSDLMRNWLGAGDCRSWDDAVLGVCCTLC